MGVFCLYPYVNYNTIPDKCKGGCVEWRIAMTEDRNEYAKRVLNYWHEIEFLTPTAFPKNEEIALTDCPWLIHSNNTNVVEECDDNIDALYEIYIGKVETNDLNKKLLESMKADTSIIDVKHSTKACMCAFKVKVNGELSVNSFGISPYVWAINKLISEDGDLEIEEFGTITDKIRNDISNIITIPKSQQAIDEQKIIRISDEVLEKIFETIKNYIPKLMEVCFYEYKIYETKRYDESDKDLSENEIILSSFYVDDIKKMLSSTLSKNLIDYANSLRDSSNISDRIEIDENIDELKAILHPLKYPLGKWPSKHIPSLMQQVAINIAISSEENKSFSVNGPPGTGKTTLLKEIVASNVVERAIKLAEYNNPDDAFSEIDGVYKLDDKISKYGIVVAANSNNAANNISKEFPIAKKTKSKETLTELFDINKNEDIYFTEISDRLLKDESSWGLISCALGNKANNSNFISDFWGNSKKNILSFFRIYEHKGQNWKGEVEKFKDKYNEVLACRQNILNDIEKANSIEVLEKEIICKANDIEKQKLVITELNNSKNLKLKNIYSKEQDIANNNRNIQLLSDKNLQLERKINIIKKERTFLQKILPFLFYNCHFMLQIKQFKQEIAKNKLKEIDIETNSQQYQRDIEKIKEDIRLLDDNICHEQKKLEKKNFRIAEIKKNLNKTKDEVSVIKNKYGNNYAMDVFWKDVSSNKESQESTPWTFKAYDKLREELFYQALMLHKSFILNSKCAIKNIKSSRKAILHEPLKEKEFIEVFNTLQLLVPVVSTTFASVATLFSKVGTNELGMVIIDEAGQATPQSAAGIINRASKVIAVGDPMQIEPINTLPNLLLKKIATKHQISEQLTEKSVQEFLDGINRYGGKRDKQYEEVWVGCPLVIHRRCIDPMFSISNEIAYAGKMICKTNEPKENEKNHFMFEKSFWANISGDSTDKCEIYIDNQINWVISKINEYLQWYGRIPDLYIISPFNSVVDKIKKDIKNKYGYKSNIGKWINNACGTVHTFQGKEADEVIIVLGGTKDGTINWAAKKPNILNVAATRAKYRLVIVGDKNRWNKFCFSTAIEQLPMVDL